MKAIRYMRPRHVEVADIPKPDAGGLVLLKVKAAGICGSDIGAFRGTNTLVSYPRVIGHEIAGEVVSVPELNPRGLKCGDRVVVDPYIYCNRCYPCRIGRTNCCENLQVLGVHIDGGMSEFFAHPADMLVPIPNDLGWQDAVLAEPLTIALHGIHRAMVASEENVLIFGAGPIGLLTAMAVKAYNANPIIVDPENGRLDMARSIGIEKTINPNDGDIVAMVRKLCAGNLCEAVIEASGANSAIRNALDCVANAGRIVFTGWPKKMTELPTDLITKKELDIRGARNSKNEFEEALELLDSKDIPFNKIVTGCISITETPDVIMDIDKNPGSHMKVIVSFP